MLKCCRVTTEVKLLRRHTFPEGLIVDLTANFYILTQSWLYVLFILPLRRIPHKVRVCEIIWKVPSTGNGKIQSATYQS